MRVIGEVKCYHCGHVSGEVEGTRTDKLVLHSFKPRQGYEGEPPKPGQRIRCERCQGPVYVEDLRPVPLYAEIFAPAAAAAKKLKSNKHKAA
jgi:hypothetical protein